jgi:glycosyltransferase involved in cell wall biosynthesis
MTAYPGGSDVLAIKVAIVAPEGLTGRGGIGRILTYLVRQLAATRDIQISVHRTRYSEQRELKHLSVPFALAVFAWQCFFGKIDVVHINVAPRGSTWRKRLYADVARWAGKPVILHLHGSGYDDFYVGLSPNAQRAVRFFFARANAVVALSDYWVLFLRETMEVPAGRIVRIPNGVPAARPRGEAVAAHLVPVILFLGVVGERKGVDVLLNAFAELQAQGHAARLVICGNGQVEAMTRRAYELGISDHTHFLGWVSEEEADRQLRAADIFVLPSRAENQPVSILEAMARALPVVASEVGAIPEQVVQEKTGLLVPAGNVPVLAAALTRLIASRDLRERLGEAGRERFENIFSVEACAERFTALYRTLAGRGTLDG